MRVTVHMPDPVGEEAARLAKERGISVSALYKEAVEKHTKEARRQLAVERMDRLFGSGGVDPNIDQIIKEERRRSDRSFE